MGYWEEDEYEPPIKVPGEEYFESEADAETALGESDAHPPLEPGDYDRHALLCEGCGDVLVYDCACSCITDHFEAGMMCDACEDETEAFQ